MVAIDVCTGILFTDAVGLPNWVVAGAAVDLPLPLPTLIGIEVILFALLELKRYEGWKKTGKVNLRLPFYKAATATLRRHVHRSVILSMHRRLHRRVAYVHCALGLMALSRQSAHLCRAAS